MSALEKLNNYVSNLYKQLTEDKQTYFEWGLLETSENIDIELGHIRNILQMVIEVKKEVNDSD